MKTRKLLHLLLLFTLSHSAAVIWAADQSTTQKDGGDELELPPPHDDVEVPSDASPSVGNHTLTKATSQSRAKRFYFREALIHMRYGPIKPGMKLDKFGVPLPDQWYVQYDDVDLSQVDNSVPAGVRPEKVQDLLDHVGLYMRIHKFYEFDPRVKNLKMHIKKAKDRNWPGPVSICRNNHLGQ